MALEDNASTQFGMLAQQSFSEEALLRLREEMTQGVLRERLVSLFDVSLNDPANHLTAERSLFDRLRDKDKALEEVSFARAICDRLGITLNDLNITSERLERIDVDTVYFP